MPILTKSRKKQDAITKKSKDITTYYNGIASGYDQLYELEQQQKIQAFRNDIHINKSTKILDVGCGTGISTQFSCKAVGIDPSQKLITLAQQKNTNPLVMFICERAENISQLKFNSKEFDYCLCISAVHHFSKLPLILKEIHRISKNSIISILHKAQKKEYIMACITKEFKVIKTINERKDVILILE